MADIERVQGAGIPHTLVTRWVDVGGGVHALAIYDTSAAAGAVRQADVTDRPDRLAGSFDVPTAIPTTYNVTCTVADTEYSQALPANCRGFEFQARTEAIVRYAFVTGKVATPTAPYHTLKAGDYYFSPQINQAAAPSTLYVASPTAGTVVELLAWT